MKDIELKRPEVTLLTVGGGGLNIAIDLTKAEMFKSYYIIAYDSDSSYVEEILKQEKNLPLYFSTIPDNHGVQTTLTDLNYYSEDLLDWETTVGGMSKIMILCTTLGGKVGTNLAPLVGLAASLQGRFVISVYSLPLKFEGDKRMIRAIEASEKIIDMSNIAIEQHNDYLGKSSELKMNEIHLPMVNSFRNIYDKSIYLISEKCKEYEDVEKLVPQEYQQENEKLISVYVNSYRTTLIKNKIKYFKI